VACGSRDAQTLALDSEGNVYSWGDGDFGKLGRGGSDGCCTPQKVERLVGHRVVQIECGAQFSVALTATGQVKYIFIIFFLHNLNICIYNYYFISFVRCGLGVKVSTTD